MELKSWVVGENVAGIKSSNRTFMELKCQDDAGINLRLHCSNRTFMELK